MRWTIEEIHEQLKAAHEEMRPAFRHLAESEKAAKLANEELQRAVIAYGKLYFNWATIRYRLRCAEERSNPPSEEEMTDVD